MSKVVSQEEVLALHQFCIRHFVSHYDVRLELVDHLASSIETIWMENQETPFEMALEKVYAGYGKTGFRKLIREKEIGVEKTSNKGILQIIKSFFSWPHITFVLSIAIICYSFYDHYSKGEIQIPKNFIMAFCILAIVIEFSIAILLHRLKKTLSKPLLSVSVYYGFYVVYIADYIIISHIVNIFFEGNFAHQLIRSPEQYILYVIVCSASILTNLAKFQYTKKIFKQARQNYPLAFK